MKSPAGLAALFAIGLTAFLSSGMSFAQAERGGEQSVAEYLSRIDREESMARQGVYGKLDSKKLDELSAARKFITAELAGHKHYNELPHDQQLALFNAQDKFRSIIGSKDRTICEKRPIIGTRVPTYECLPVLVREARAAGAAEATKNLQRTANCAQSDGRCTD